MDQPHSTPPSADITAPQHRTWPARIILFKEFREIFRDRRTLMSVIIGPLVLTPTLFALMGSFIGGQVQKARTEVYKIGLVNADASPQLASLLGNLSDIRLYPTAGTEQAEAWIKQRRLSAAIVLPRDAQRRIDAAESVPIQVLDDAGEQTSEFAAARIRGHLTTIAEQIVAGRLQARGLPPGYARPFVVTDQPIRSGGSGGTAFLSMMLPYILTISAITGAIYAALDQVAGEKERGTLETLLVSPASRRDIVLGKFGAIVLVCLVSSVLAVIGLGIAFSLPTNGLRILASGGLHMSLAAVVVCLGVMIPLAVLFAGLLLAVSTFARNQKEAQTYLGPLLMVVFIPMMASIFLGSDASLSLALIPILGPSIIIKQALTGSYNVGFILVAFAASVGYAALSLAFATRLFQNEGILIKA